MENKLLGMLQRLILQHLKRIHTYCEAIAVLDEKEAQKEVALLEKGSQKAREFLMELGFMIRFMDGEAPEVVGEEQPLGFSAKASLMDILSYIVKLEDQTVELYKHLMEAHADIDNDLYNRIRLQRTEIQSFKQGLTALLSS